MLPLRPLGSTGLTISAMGLGTVKWGRNQGVKYPAFDLPDDSHLHSLLDLAASHGLNFLDTAPAYGLAEQRLGKILAERPDHKFLVLTKTGETFLDGESSFDFSVAGTEASLQASLRHLRTDCLDGVQVHCAADDVATLTQTPVLETLRKWQQKGHLKCVGVSTMTVAGGLLAAELADFLMVPFSVSYQVHRPVIQRAHALGKAVLLKRALYSGAALAEARSLADHLQAAYEEPGVTAVVAGTITTAHLTENLLAGIQVIAGC